MCYPKRTDAIAFDLEVLASYAKKLASGHDEAQSLAEVEEEFGEELRELPKMYADFVASGPYTK